MVLKQASVAPHPSDRDGHNVLVLDLVDVVIPLEMDLDEDPENPDTLRLRREDGAYEAVLRADEPDVEPDGDNPLLLYTFRDVPLGTFDLEVLVDEDWVIVIDDLRITPDGVFHGEDSFAGDDFDGGQLGIPEEEWEEDEDDEDDEEDDREEGQEEEEEMEAGHDDEYETDDY